MPEPPTRPWMGTCHRSSIFEVSAWSDSLRHTQAVTDLGSRQLPKSCTWSIVAWFWTASVAAPARWLCPVILGSPEPASAGFWDQFPCILLNWKESIGSLPANFFSLKPGLVGTHKVERCMFCSVHRLDQPPFSFLISFRLLERSDELCYCPIALLRLCCHLPKINLNSFRDFLAFSTFELQFSRYSHGLRWKVNVPLWSPWHVYFNGQSRISLWYSQKVDFLLISFWCEFKKRQIIR